MMLVRASKMGFYGTLRYPGDVFEAADGETASWFEPALPHDTDHGEHPPSLSSKEIKAQLDALGVSYPATANKAALAALLAEHQ